MAMNEVQFQKGLSMAEFLLHSKILFEKDFQMLKYKSLAAALVLSALSVNASAGLVGTSVTGSLTFGASSVNYFASSNGFVPAGCSNSGSGGTTVTIADPAVEFCFNDGANRDTADFSNMSLTLTDVASTLSGAGPFTTTFQLTPGVVASVAKLSDTFTGGGLSFTFANNLLTISSPGLNAPGTYSGVFSFSPAMTAVPEPSTLSMVALMLGLLGGFGLKRRADSA